MNMPICPKCHGEVFERVTDEVYVHRAEYVDGKLTIVCVKDAVLGSFVRCANKDCYCSDFTNYEEIEELFW